MSDTPVPRGTAPVDAPTLQVFGSLSSDISATTPVTRGSLTYLYGFTDPGGIYYGPGAPIVDGNVLYTVTSPPSHGTLLKDGVLTTQFTAQDITDGRIFYQNDGSNNRSDSFSLWCVVTEVPGVVKPYTPQFTTVFNTNPAHGTNQGAWYAGVTLLGSTQMPTLDSFSGAGGNWGVATSVISEAFFTTQPNDVVFLVAVSTGSALSLPYPAPVPVDHITFPGLTFTRLGGGSFNTINWDPIHGVQHYCTTNAELFYALAPSIIPSTHPFSATWAVTGQFIGPEACGITLAAFGNLADLSHPWGTDPASIQFNNVGNAVPGGLSLNTSVSDQLVLPVLFWMQAGDYDGNIGIPGPPGGGGFYPKGFGFSSGGLGGSGGTTGTANGGTQQRTGICYATIPIHFPPAPPVLIDSELVFEPRVGFVDFTVEANRRLFISSEGTPAWMGVRGELPFLGSPAVYLTTTGAPLAFTTNNGNGGAFPASGDIEPHDGPGCSFYTVGESAGLFDGSDWRLSLSDDGGETWSTLVKPRVVGMAGNYRQRMRWLKMGQSRQRLLRLESTSHTRRNIIGIYIDSEQGMDS